MYSLAELKKKIEETRTEMYKTYENNPNNPQVLSISKSLDVLLNHYDQALKEVKKLE
ncbi:aspartyl-phosphate phosphatase Spo0E family protein [Virgibacillus siamensis]|uniref:aspartyl-phosphate phosphatase Spo0E family protein n=1 Tax=Virgibacillus siamensis TaxID=480071 RepID=UPI00111565EF|nr:aspartyl-phosphate phosphatase Spo0E family protein [Virgibacillus siamensis]